MDGNNDIGIDRRSRAVRAGTRLKAGRRLLHGVAAAALGLMTANAARADIARVPLIIQNQVPPNFTFVLDDSGSMQWAPMHTAALNEFLAANGFDVPSEGKKFTNYLVPPPEDLYGVANYGEVVPTFADGNVHNLIARSAANNAIYYDPDVVYEPWSNSDGSPRSDADPANALYNPELPGKGGLDLTSEQTQSACWFDDGGTNDPDNAVGDPCTGFNSFWPITYYVYDGAGDRLDAANYTKFQVQGNTILKDGTVVSSVDAPDDAALDVWTAADVQQNFANWFSYTRSRILAARSGVGRAFAAQGGGFRLAYGAFNENDNDVDGVDTDTLVRGVRDFAGSDRDDFFDFLYGHPIPRAGTPLRTSLNDAGNYYERTDGRGPWNEDPTSSNNGDDLECRQSYAIAMTDGFWNGGDPDLEDLSGNDVNENTDGTDGPLINNPNGDDFQYEAEDPSEDVYEETLADVAMHFWRRDLRSDLDNEVPVVPQDPAFWQHMVTFGISFGPNGTLDPENDLGDLSDGTIEWPDPTDNQDAERIDDLWHATVNSRGSFLSAKDPQQFAEEFDKLLSAALARTEGSAAAVAANSGSADTDTRIYQARFDSSRWSGQLFAFPLTEDGKIDSDNDGEILDEALWEASEELPTPTNRGIFTVEPGTNQGSAFEWLDLTAGQQTALNTDIDGNADGQGESRLAYLRGDTSDELRNGGSFRNREQRADGTINVLGDIVHSSPFLARKRDFGFQVLPGSEGSDYTDYKNSSVFENRPEMLYVGANDGMLHAFRADTGEEEFAYVPDAVFDNLSDLTSPDYTHRFFVDESPRKVDAYFDHNADGSEEWRSVLIGSTGAGGKGVFALDVTEPTSFGEGDVLWEYTHADLGFTMGRPTIARLPDGDFYAIFGDGYDETDGSGNIVGDGSATAQLFIVNLDDGTTKKIIDTGVNDLSAPNGLSSMIPVDIDDDRVTEIIYAGDLEGNLWKFDVSSSNPSNWDLASISGGPSPSPLFTAEGPGGGTQPITVRPEVTKDPETGERIVIFGTGKDFEDGDLEVGADPTVQSLYGIRDKGTNLSRNDLLEQEIIEETTAGGETFRVVTDNAPGNNPDGWFVDLKVSGGDADGERVTTEAIVRGDRAIFVSQVPPADPCQFAGTSWLYEVDAVKGSRLDEAVFDVNDDGVIDSSDMVNGKLPSAIKKADVITRPTILEAAGDKELKFSSQASGGIDIQEESDAIDADFGRGSWRQIY